VCCTNDHFHPIAAEYPGNHLPRTRPRLGWVYLDASPPGGQMQPRGAAFFVWYLDYFCSGRKQDLRILDDFR
jgi:hypothetical protein